MIEQIKIKNYQCHKRFILDLDSQVTILVGSSDAGKSAIFRALRWLATNRPAGNAFITHGRETASVDLRVDGRAAKRSRGRDGGNLYQLDGNEYAAFGQDVPDPVVNLLNLDSGLNFQRQHDAPFWFSLTPGEVARELNKVVNLELIDRTLANAASEVRRIKAVINVSKERLDKSRKEADRLAWVKEADEALKEVEAKEAELTENRQKGAALASILQDLGKIQKRIDRLSWLESGGVLAVQKAQRAIEAAEQVENLRNHLDKLGKVSCQLNETRKQLAKAESELSEVKTCPACGKPR